MPEFHQTLSKISTEIKTVLSQNLPAKVIFDLDSTVFDVSIRINRIFKEFAALPEIQKQYPHQAKILNEVTPHHDDYGVRRTLERYSFPLHDMTFFHRLVEYWKKAFFSGDYLHYDVPYPGAAEYINSLKNSGAEILYLTGRDVPRMKEGTLSSLRQHGLPVENDASNLFLKPHSEISDVDFKKIFFQNLKDPNVWFFENEPANILICMSEAPQVQVVFVDTVHSGKGPLPPDTIQKIKSWVII